MKRSALREFLGALALAALPACNSLPLDNGNARDLDLDLDPVPDLSQPWNRCEGYDAGSGSFVITVPSGGDDGGVRACEDLCYALTPPNAYNPQLHLYCRDLSDDGTSRVIECNYVAMCGRRPAGLSRARIASRSPVGRYFARCAHLEAASVHAFRCLARELRAHGLIDLAEAAERAALDEIRHTRAMAQLARRFGAKVPRVRVRRMKARSLLALAKENAAEGCVGETFGAALALFQARRARDPEVRHAFRAIAEDEVRHAELAWQVAGAVEKRLNSAQIKSVEKARVEALGRVSEEIGPLPASLVEIAGLPDERAALLLLQGVARGFKYTEV